MTPALHEVTDAECDGLYTPAGGRPVESSPGSDPVTFANCYEDGARAQAYATLEFKNTYHLAYRNIPAILGEHVRGRKSLDFGCGTGRSTRFLRQLGLEVTGAQNSLVRAFREHHALGIGLGLVNHDAHEFVCLTHPLLQLIAIVFQV